MPVIANVLVLVISNYETIPLLKWSGLIKSGFKRSIRFLG